MVVCLLKLQLSIAKNPYLNNLSLTFILCCSYTLRHLLMCVRNLLGLNYRTMAHVIVFGWYKIRILSAFLFIFIWLLFHLLCTSNRVFFFLLCGLHSTCFYRLTFPSIQLKSNKREKKLSWQYEWKKNSFKSQTIGHFLFIVIVTALSA